MIRTIGDIDLEKLKKQHQRLYYFGLGFIQLKIDETYRLHFYTNKLPSIVDSVHNHRYDFSSRILKGEFINKIYSLTKGDSHVVENESCNIDVVGFDKNSKSCSLVLEQENRYRQGDEYRMRYEQFHQVEPVGEVITVLSRSEYKQEFAQVVREVGEENICPFSLKVEEKQLWSIIEEMIND